MHSTACTSVSDHKHPLLFGLSGTSMTQSGIKYHKTALYMGDLVLEHVSSNWHVVLEYPDLNTWPCNKYIFFNITLCVTPQYFWEVWIPKRQRGGKRYSRKQEAAMQRSMVCSCSAPQIYHTFQHKIDCINQRFPIFLPSFPGISMSGTRAGLLEEILDLFMMDGRFWMQHPRKKAKVTLW